MEVAEKARIEGKVETVLSNWEAVGSGIPQDISDAVRQTAEAALDAIISITGVSSPADFEGR